MKKIFAFAMALFMLIINSGCSQSTLNLKSETLKSEQPNAAKKYNTYTGLVALPPVSHKVPDPLNESGFSEEKIEHSFGVAKDGKPNEISVQSQQFFESNGFDAVTYDKKSGKNLYLTFDCGYENGYTQIILDVLKEKNVPAAFFCTYTDIRDNAELIAKIINDGHIVGNHSTNHPSFAEINREKMTKEIEECDNYLRENFGYTSPYFRFPKGEYSQSAMNLVNSLGYKCIFWSLAYSDWDTANQKGADYAFETVTARLHPGAIILLHSVSSDNANAMGRIIDYAREQGYEFKSLDSL